MVYFKRLIHILILVLFLPILIWAQQMAMTILSQASVKKADLVVDTLNIEAEISGNWLNFAQGGEETPPMLVNTVERMKLLKPQYIRLDHIFDFYNIVGNDGHINFSKLDETVDDILAMGAKPFFSLSYMPRQFTDRQSVIDAPADWKLWQNLVMETVEYYSGKANKNIKDVYYEVWNEPDLPQFGGWKLGGNKNYNLLYQYASLGAQEARNVNNFFLGGPAVGSYYPSWVADFISYADKNNLRLDFYSWHRYHTNPARFREDAINIRKILTKYPKFTNLPLVLSEWGMDSENNLNNNSEKAAAHTLATIFKTEDVIARPISFEVKDGPPPMGGKWGLITHEKDDIPLKLKPRFKAFSASTFLFGKKLKVSGWGSNVAALSSKTAEGTIYVLINNYDVKGQNWENVPLSVTGLPAGIYKIINQQILTNSVNSSEMTVTDGQIKLELVMLPNSIRLLEIKKSGPIAEYVSGVSGQTADRALVLTGINDLRLEPFEFNFSGKTEVSFDIRPFWADGDNAEINILKIGLRGSANEIAEINIKKVISNNIDFLLLTANNNKNSERIAVQTTDLINKGWHKVRIGISSDKMALNIDDLTSDRESNIYSLVSKISGIYFYPFNGAIDNLELRRDGTVIFKRDFN